MFSLVTQSFATTPTSDRLSYRYPEECVITDIQEPDSGSATPAEQDDDFFNSWDKPTIKRPSNPPSRVGTPGVGSRTASPFLNAPANGNGPSRPKSPLSASTDPTTAPAAKAVPSSAIKKTATAGARPKANILGAKKKGLGAKKVSAVEGLDFDAAEKKAKEEADRIAKLGYNPDEEEPINKGKSTASDASNIISPTPISPSGAGYGSGSQKEKSSQDVERLGLGVARLGFGQVGSSKAAAAPPKKMGFGAVARSKEGMIFHFTQPWIGMSQTQLT